MPYDFSIVVDIACAAVMIHTGFACYNYKEIGGCDEYEPRVLIGCTVCCLCRHESLNPPGFYHGDTDYGTCSTTPNVAWMGVR